jgi:cytoskeleton protein RodZ
VSVGESLARAREESGLTVEEVSDATRIRSGLIRSIEADEFAPCGAPVYARGHIRSIAHVIGIDPEPLVAEYDRAVGGPPPSVTETASVREPEPRSRTERRRPNWTAAMILVLLAVVAFAAVDLATGHHHSPGGPVAGHSPPSPTPTPSATSSPQPSSVALASSVSMQLSVTNTRSWCSVQQGGATGPYLFEGTLVAGQSHDFHSTAPLYVVVGNAGAVSLVVNGVSVGSLGPQGYVYRHTFGPGAPTSAGQPPAQG